MLAVRYFRPVEEKQLAILKLSALGLPLPKELLFLAGEEAVTEKKPEVATSSESWQDSAVGAPSYDGRKHLWLYYSPEGKDDPNYYERIPNEWKEEAAAMVTIGPEHWTPPGAPEELPPEFIKWCLSINPRFDAMVPYKPFFMYCEAARRWNAEPTTIEKFTPNSQEWIDYGLRDMHRCAANKLYGLDRYTTIKEDGASGRRNYKASTPQAMIAYIKSLRVSAIIKKGRHAAISSTFNALNVFDIMLSPSYKGALITDDVETTAKALFQDKFMSSLTNMPSWFRPEDKHNHIAQSTTDRIILQFGKKTAGKADKKKQTAEYSIVSGKDPQAVNGMTLTELDIDEAQNVSNASVIVEERRPQQWAEVNGKMRLVRVTYLWGTGNAKGKHSKEFDDEYQKVKSQMEQGKNTGGWVALFLDGFCRPGVDKDHYFAEWERIASEENSKTSTSQDRKLIFASRFPLTDEDATAQNTDTILPVHIIKAHRDRIITRLKGRLRHGRFKEDFDLSQPLPPGSEYPFFVRGATFEEDHSGDPELSPVTMLFDREQGWRDNYFQGTDPIQSYTGRSKMASNIIAASAHRILTPEGRTLHLPASVCWISMRHPNPSINYKQVKLMGMYYANTGYPEQRACPELVEWNQGHDYVRFCEGPHILLGDSIVHNSELPPIYQDGGKHPGMLMTSITKGHVHADIIRFNDECGHNEYSLQYYAQLATMKQTEHDGKIKFGTMDADRFNDDLVFAKTFSYIRMKMSYLAPSRLGDETHPLVEERVMSIRGADGYVRQQVVTQKPNFERIFA